MADKSEARNNLTALLNFVENAPENQEIINMDCNDHCEQMSLLAEQVADGAKLDDILPELEEHMKYWGDCREEFIALVNVLKAEMMDDLPELE
ncbi:MAG: hypothetical protein WBC91_21220 [Phototrophicaceae bacterium]